MSRELKHEYAPAWAPHFVGHHEEVVYDPETHRPEPVKFSVKCGICGEEFAGVCETGLPRSRISKLAIAHAHRKPLGA